MSGWALVAIAALYAWAALDMWRAGNLPMALVFGAFAVSNVGFLWAGLNPR